MGVPAGRGLEGSGSVRGGPGRKTASLGLGSAGSVFLTPKRFHVLEPMCTPCAAANGQCVFRRVQKRSSEGSSALATAYVIVRRVHCNEAS